MDSNQPDITLQKIVGVLTEYEENLISEALVAEKTLYYARALFNLVSFDEDLAALHSEIKAFAELLATLPAKEEPGGDRIEFRSIFASKDTLSDLQAKFGSPNVTVHHLPLGDDAA